MQVVCLNTHLIYIRFLLPPQLLFLFCSVISQRWRSDTFDNSGPRGVNTEAIARRSVSLFARILPADRKSPRLFTDREAVRSDWHKGSLWVLEVLNRSHIAHCRHGFHHNKTSHSSQSEWKKLPFLSHDDTKICINHKGMTRTWLWRITQRV